MYAIRSYYAIINPLFSDRTATRMAKAFKERYGLGEDFKFNNLRKGTGATIAQVRQEMKAALTSRIKILSSLNIAERRVPQDGRSYNFV